MLLGGKPHDVFLIGWAVSRFNTQLVLHHIREKERKKQRRNKQRNKQRKKERKKEKRKKEGKKEKAFRKPDADWTTCPCHWQLLGAVNSKYFVLVGPKSRALVSGSM